MRGPLVTVVTPSYNQGRFIRATIESVLSQGYPELEYIIMDGGSTDETAAVVREYSGRLTWISEKDRGQSHAINKGFRLAKGSIVAWLNSDDVFLPGAVQKAVQAFEQHPAAGAVYGEGYLIDIDGKITRRFPATEPFNLWKLVHVYDYILQQTVHFRRDALEAVGYVDESLHFGMDWDLLIRLGKRFPIVYLPEDMGCLREYGEAKSFAGGRVRFRELAKIVRQHSSMRYPPAYFYYGLGTYRDLFSRWVGGCTVPGLRTAASLLARGMTVAIGRAIDRLPREAQGWYSDGWATTKVKWMLPVGSGSIRIQGSLPDLGNVLPRQRVEVRHNGHRVGEFAFSAGSFDVQVPLQAAKDGPMTLDLIADRYFVPSASDSPDRRRLAYMLKSVTRACLRMPTAG